MSVTLYRNGSVYSAADPLATAMLVDSGTVAWVGGDDAATAMAPDSARVVDLNGALVTPGFVDSHVHVTETGLSLSTLDLRSATSARDLLDAVAAAAPAAAQGSTIQGFGWDETTWSDPTLPTADELDRAAGGKHVYLARVDVHSGLVSVSLAREAKLAEAPGWDGTSFVAEEAHVRARAAGRRLTSERRAQLQQVALSEAARRGFVALAEMGMAVPEGEEDLLLLCQRNAGRGTAGQSDADRPAAVEILPYWGELVDSAASAQAVLDRFAARGVNLLGLAGDLNIDGSIGTRTALLREDYTDAPGLRGTGFTTVAQAAAHLAACSEVGTQSGFHVIGDAGMDVVIQALRLAADQVGAAAVRRAGHRMEHAEFTDDAAIAALAEFSVTASLQPLFDGLWGGSGGLYQQRLGAARASGMNRIASLLAAGVPVALGSDSPVTDLAGWKAVAAALNHHQASERVSARAAFIAHTRGGWRAAKEQNPLMGQLVPGAPASFAVWEVDELMVQVADERVQSWSTDPRARTPLLPALDTENEPRCLRTVHHGEQLFDTGELTGS